MRGKLVGFVSSCFNPLHCCLPSIFFIFNNFYLFCHFAVRFRFSEIKLSTLWKCSVMEKSCTIFLLYFSAISYSSHFQTSFKQETALWYNWGETVVAVRHCRLFQGYITQEIFLKNTSTTRPSYNSFNLSHLVFTTLCNAIFEPCNIDTKLYDNISRAPGINPSLMQENK